MDYISILPQDLDLTSEHRYLRLPHPRTNLPQLYLPTKINGRETILEVVKLDGSKRRTWFIGDSTIDAGSMLIHHSIDPLFLVIPIILSLTSTTTSPAPFQPLSALISTASSSPAFSLPPPFTSAQTTSDGWNEDINRSLELKSVKRVFKLCCDRKVVPAAPPSPPTNESSPCVKGQAYYRPSVEALHRLLTVKVEYFADEAQWGCFDHLVRGLGRDGLLGKDVDPELVKCARLKTSIEHFSQYLPKPITASLEASYDFSSLQTHLANLSAAAIAASIPPASTKTDKSAAGAKRKANAASRGVEALKKVNTSSMAKLTSFFKPKDK